MKLFDWSDEKNQSLKQERDISFEEIIYHITQNDLLDILEHPNQDRYPGQRIFIVRVEDYVYLVPFGEDAETIFLKTIIPSRKFTKIYLRGHSK